MNGTKTILICDDKKNILEVLKDFFEEKDFSVLLSGSGEETLDIIRTEIPDIVLTDYKLPGISGIDLIEKIIHIDKTLPVILITAFGSIPNAVDAMRKGAYDYLTKPLDYELLYFVVERALEQKEIYAQNTVLVEELKDAYGIQNMIGKSPEMIILDKM
ncbi:MAG: sigma-54-dependent Fis family transcriptional regulator, partial [Spirochaetales bacterium]|nr:sigma-54-dependent Fis family transcriptional regulator [Spirochaetales bacterium]